MPPEVEWQLWQQLRGAFRVHRFVAVPIVPEGIQLGCTQYATMEDALASCPGKKVFLEPTGDQLLFDMPPCGHDLILVLGNTAMSNVELVGKEDYSVRIKTPQRTHLYGVSAAAIALAYWVGQ